MKHATASGEIENGQLVGNHGGDVVVVLPRVRMSRREALVHAAWLVAVAESCDDTDEDAGAEFLAILDRVRNT